MSVKQIIIFAIIILVVITATVFVMLNFFIANNDAEPQEVIKESFYYNLDQMICNLKDTSSKAVLKIVIETTDKELTTEFQNKSFLVKNMINKIVRNKTKVELDGSDGQDNLEKELVEELRKLFDNEEIINVYFDELIIQ